MSNQPTSQTCPQCGGEIQASVELYLTMGPDGEWRAEYDPREFDPRTYCENDHETDLSGPQRDALDRYLGTLAIGGDEAD